VLAIVNSVLCLHVILVAVAADSWPDGAAAQSNAGDGECSPKDAGKGECQADGARRRRWKAKQEAAEREGTALTTDAPAEEKEVVVNTWRGVIGAAKERMEYYESHLSKDQELDPKPQFKEMHEEKRTAMDEALLAWDDAKEHASDALAHEVDSDELVDQLPYQGQKGRLQHPKAESALRAAIAADDWVDSLLAQIREAEKPKPGKYLLRVYDDSSPQKMLPHKSGEVIEVWPQAPLGKVIMDVVQGMAQDGQVRVMERVKAAFASDFFSLKWEKGKGVTFGMMLEEHWTHHEQPDGAKLTTDTPLNVTVALTSSTGWAEDLVTGQGVRSTPNGAPRLFQLLFSEPEKTSSAPLDLPRASRADAPTNAEALKAEMAKAGIDPAIMNVRVVRE